MGAALRRALGPAPEDSVLAAIEHLSGRERRLFLMRGFERASARDVALILDEEPAEVERSYAHLLAGLRQRVPGAVFDAIDAG